MNLLLYYIGIKRQIKIIKSPWFLQANYETFLVNKFLKQFFSEKYFFKSPSKRKLAFGGKIIFLTKQNKSSVLLRADVGIPIYSPSKLRKCFNDIPLSLETLNFSSWKYQCLRDENYNGSLQKPPLNYGANLNNMAKLQPNL